MDLSALKALLNVCTLAMTATASPKTITSLVKNLCLANCKDIKVSPNRPNLFISKAIRKSNNKGYEGYDIILNPIAEELNVKWDSYPMTIVYLKLKYCGYAFQSFCKNIKNHFVGDEKMPRSRLFTQFHASSTKEMKNDVLEEIKLQSSRIRVVFATTALDMGVDAPHIRKIIHIRPPSSLESYVQEIGRAGRDGAQSDVYLFYNNSDVSSKIMTESMQNYCTEKACLRKFILEYFGFSSVKQCNCCSNCEPPKELEIQRKQQNEQKKYRQLNGDKNVLAGELRIILNAWMVNYSDL